MGSYENNSYTLGLGYVDPSDVGSQHLKQMMDYFYQSNYTVGSPLWVQGNIDMMFKVGNQAFNNFLYGQGYQQAQKFFLNLIMRHLSMVTGFQRRNRKSTITMPLKEGDDPLADDYNKVLRWCDDRDGFQEYLSQSFEGAVSVGVNWLFAYLDYANDAVSGDLFTDSVSYNNVLFDQYFRKQDLSDCNGIWRRRWTSAQGANLLLPGYENELKKIKPQGMKDGRFPVQAELQNTPVNNLFTYDEFHYRTTREATVIVDPKSGESTEWEPDEDDPEDMLDRVLREQPWLQVKKMQVPTVKLVLSLGDKIVYHGKNLLGIDQYPCVPTLCYHEPDITAPGWRLRGMVRNMRDPQYLYNLRKVIELQIMQSSINSGWIYPVDAVVDPKSFRQSSGGDGFLIPLKAGRQPGEIQRIEPISIPQSLIELSNILAEDITKICGVNEELLGSATDDKSGILSMLRQGAGLTTLQTIFDKLDYTQRLYGKIRLQAIRKNFSKGKIRNILGHEADPRFWTSYSQKYSIAVEEGNYSTTQRQTELQQLLHFRELGMPIPDKSIMRAAFITDKTQIIADMEEAQAQQAQAQQAQAAAEEKKTNADVMKKYASARSDLAREKELMASAQEKLVNISALQAKAEHEMSEADMNLVKIMLELEDMQMGQFERAFKYAQAVKESNTPMAL